MREDQEKEIRDYLLSKNLSIDLLMEVQDHIISQIMDLQQRDNLNFEDAFKQTKDKWFAELSFPRYNIQFDLQDTTYFEKKITQHHKVDVFKKGLAYSLIVLLLLFLSSRILTEAAFKYIFYALIALSIALPFIQYYGHRNLFKLIKKYDNYKITWSQDLSSLSLSLAGGSAVFLYHISGHAHSVYETLNFRGESFSLAVLPLVLFYFLINATCFSAQRYYIKKLLSVKPFLKYLKASF